MKINISDNLKQLRKERSITQENLAQFLGVSFQAISKWERNEGYPDITILPSIANFFNITLDELVGMEKIKQDLRIDVLEETLKLNASEGKITENIMLLKDALKTYPNNFELLYQLSHQLLYVQANDTTEKEYLTESITIGERILEFCPDPLLCNAVKQDLCLAYLRTDQKDKGANLARQLPSIWGTKEFTLYEFLDSDRRINELQQTVLTLVCALDTCITGLVNAQDLNTTNEEKIELLDKSNQFYKVLHDQNDYYHTHVALAENYRKMSLLALESSDLVSALEYLEHAVDHAIAFDTLPSSIPYTSRLLDTLTFNISDTSKNYDHTWCSLLLNSYLKHSKYSVISDNSRFICLLEKLKTYA